MNDADRVLSKLSELLDHINKPKKSNAVADFFAHSFVITVAGALIVLLGTNWITEKFQLRDKKIQAVTAFENDIPRGILAATQQAMISSVLEDQRCDVDADRKLQNPFVPGLTGRTCKDAEAEYLKYAGMLAEHPPGTSIARLRATFDSPKIEDHSIKLGSLLGLLALTNKDSCIVEAARLANDAYAELVGMTVKDINGDRKGIPDAFALESLKRVCPAEHLCGVHDLAGDASLDLKCH